MKWEYTSLPYNGKSDKFFVAEINAIGDDGWELVQIIDGVAYFKRRVIATSYVKTQKEACDNGAVEFIYSLYPTKCPQRNASLGKSKKDKERIKKLLKTYTKEQIEAVIRKEIEDKYGKSYMQNFSTLLNNFPDPTCAEIVFEEQRSEKFILNGVEYK